MAWAVHAIVYNDLAEAVNVHTYNGEDIGTAFGQGWVPYYTYSVEPGTEKRVEARAWAGGINLQISHGGTSSGIFKTSSGNRVMLSAVVDTNGSHSHLKLRSIKITNDTPYRAFIEYSEKAKQDNGAETVTARKVIQMGPNQSETIKYRYNAINGAVDLILTKLDGDSSYVVNASAKYSTQQNTTVSSLKAYCAASNSAGAPSSMGYSSAR